MILEKRKDVRAKYMRGIAHVMVPVAVLSCLERWDSLARDTYEEEY